MAASKARVGRGTIVSIGGITGATGGTFIPIEEVMDSSFSGSAWGTEDVSNFDSGVDEEFITTMRNNGEVTLKFNVVDGAVGQAALEAAYNTGSKYDFKVQLKAVGAEVTGTLYTFSALVTTFLDIPITTKGAIQGTTKLKISGNYTKVAGA